MQPTDPSLDDDSLPAIARTPPAAKRSPVSADAVAATVVANATVPAGCLPAWEVGTLEPPPHFSARNWTALIGPGILLAGSSVGAGEWLFGPAVSAQFGGTFLWLATISIVTQVFYNLEVMRYTLYCGEPVFVGFFRLIPGPKFWTAVYLVLCVAHIWPFMAANAAVPLTAALLGHLPGNGTVSIVFWTISESNLVKLLGYVIFLLAFLPLIFGGKIYNVLERMMAVKLVIVLGFLVSVAIFLISPRNAWEVFAGFFRFGQVALRAETVIAGPHFDVRMHEGSAEYVIKGTYEGNTPVVTKLGIVDEDRQRTNWFDVNRPLPANIAGAEERLLASVGPLVKPGRFLVETNRNGKSFRISGEITAQGEWSAEHVVTQAGSSRPVDQPPADLTGRDAEMVAELVRNQGFQRAGLVGYWRKHGGLPPLDWPLLAALSAIAGAGMLSNALFSNYARDKGWGMGAQTGAIPSAIGGHRIALSHVGKVFIVDEAALARWRGWFRHIVRDQAIWMTCSFIGMALPCMMSLEFIRNAPVSENRVAALTADGLASRFPAYATFWWATTLFIGFIVLAPNAVFAGDLIARLWTDLIWIGSAKVKNRPGHSVMRVYYGILAIYCVWGLVALTIMNPLQIAIIGPVLGNVALGFSAFHTLAVNRRLLPEALRPNLFMQLGLVACGVFFLGITAVLLFAPPG
jgi:hypothetical protein